MIYYRFTYNTKNLRKEDFIQPFGVNLTLLNEINKARKKYNETAKEKLCVNSDFKELYDKRDGYYIDGTKIKTKKHSYHNMSLLDTTNNKIYSVDTVSIQNYLGRYMQLGLRQIGSKSHKHIIFYNYTSNDPTITETSIENLGRYKFIDKVYDPMDHNKSI